MAIIAHSDTRILVQGITGREASIFTRESIQYGAQIVAGVTPGKGGLRVHGVPVFDTVAQAMRSRPCDATVVSVPPGLARDAALEALAHGLQLLVILTERVPRKDVVCILEQAQARGARVLGPNSLGIISPGRTRIGMCGGTAENTREVFTQGPVGIISRSGGMTTEIASLLTQCGIGQSTCVSLGGDAIVGSTALDLLPLYEADPETQALVLYCEPGGRGEERLAEHLRKHPTRLPIIAFVAGRFADRMPGKRFGHAGAIVNGTIGSPNAKIVVLREAAVIVAEKLCAVPQLVRGVLQEREVYGTVHTDPYR